MVTISFENGKAVKATNGNVSVYNYGEGIPDSFLTRIVNTLGDEFCTVENILQLFKFCHFHILTDKPKHNIVGVFNGVKMIVVVEGKQNEKIYWNKKS